MTPTIYVARHGERLDFVDPEWHKTAENPHDAPLTDRGEQQARELGVRLVDCGIKRIFASPFTRTTCTAVRAAQQLKPPCSVCIEPGMCEWLNPEWYPGGAPVWRSAADLGKSFEEVDTSYTPVFAPSSNFDRYPEARENMVVRAGKTARRIAELCGEEGNVLLVGHGSSVEGCYEALVPEAKRRGIRVTYCSLTVCEPQADGTYEAEVVVDTSHLSNPEAVATTRYI